MRIVKDGKAITSLKDWIECAEPNSNEHWRDGRSAKETARAWLGSGAALPSEIEALLANSRYLRVPLNWAAEPEPKFRFDKFPSESEGSRLLVHASDFHGKYVIAVEAKADESFGETIAEALVSATERKLRNSTSNAVLRVEQLCASLLGAQSAGEASLSELRYELLTLTAGALWEAEKRGAARAVVIVQEFVTDETSDEMHLANSVALNQFVHRISHGARPAVPVGQLVGPILVPGGPLLSANTQLFIGKVIRNIRSGAVAA